MASCSWVWRLISVRIVGVRKGGFKVRKVDGKGMEDGVVEVECMKVVGGVERVVARWRFVKERQPVVGSTMGPNRRLVGD